MINRIRQNLLIQGLFGITTLSVLFLLVLFSSELLLLPEYLEPLARFLYRGVFFMALPFWTLVSMFVDSADHHWSVGAITVVGLLTAVFWFASGWIALGYFRARKQRSVSTHSATDPSRREFLGQSLAGITILTGGGIGGYGVWVEPQRVAVREYTQAIRDLPESLRGTTLVQISDTHYGPFVSQPYLRHVIETANTLKPDLVVLTGDYVHRTPKAIPDGIGLLKDLNSRWGSLAVLGNHDFWEGAEECRERFADIDIPLIDNTRRFLTAQGIHRDQPDSGGLCMAGLGDLWEDTVDFAGTFQGLSDDFPRVVLAHNPDTAEMSDATNHRIDLMLSGHTHGGQVRIPGIGTPMVPSRYGSKYAGGLCAGPHFPVLVSRGVGMAIMPVRFGVRPEISKITLVQG